MTDLGMWVHNTECSDRKLSSPNPVPKTIREQCKKITLGRGRPRIDPKTGKQKVFNAPWILKVENRLGRDNG